MTDPIPLIARWITDSLPVYAIEQLITHIEGAKLEDQESHEIGQQLLDAINHTSSERRGS